MELNGYEFSESPFKSQLDQAIRSIGKTIGAADKKSARGIEEALYLAVKKRMACRAYEGSKEAYLIALLSDIQNAKREHSETCYDNDSAAGAFSQLKHVVNSLLAEL